MLTLPGTSKGWGTWKQSCEDSISPSWTKLHLREDGAGQTNPSKFHSVLPLNVSKGVYMCLPVWWEGNQMDLIPSSNSFLTMRQVSSLHHLDATTPQNKDFLSTKGINPTDCELWMALDCRQWDVMLGTHDCMCRKAASRKVGSAQLYKSNDCYYTFSNTHRPKR